MNYNRAYRYKECIAVYKEVYQEFDGTGGYMTDAVVEKICKKINKRLFKDFRILDKEDKLYQRELRKAARLNAVETTIRLKKEEKAKALKTRLLKKRLKGFLKKRYSGKIPDYSSKNYSTDGV